MIIECNYPKKITWILDLSKVRTAFEPFGKKTQKKIKSAIHKLDSSELEFKIDKVDADYINAFYPIYAENIKQKRNPTVHNLMDRIIVNPAHEFPFFSLSLYKNEKLIGGLIFTDRQSLISTAFRTFPKTVNLDLPISISYVAEYYLNDFALKNNKESIRRGSDNNLFGTNGSIGLAHFKLLCGYEPYMQDQVNFDKGKNEMLHRFEWDGKNSTLVFEEAKPGNRITSGMLLIDEKDKDIIEKKYPVLFKSDGLQIKQIDFAML